MLERGLKVRDQLSRYAVTVAPLRGIDQRLESAAEKADEMMEVQHRGGIRWDIRGGRGQLLLQRRERQSE